MIPSTEDFERVLNEILESSQKRGLPFVDVVSGTLHRKVGGYPARNGNHQMPSCCNAMKKLMKPKDKILHEPLKGRGATLTIRYSLPR